MGSRPPVGSDQTSLAPPPFRVQVARLFGGRRGLSTILVLAVIVVVSGSTASGTTEREPAAPAPPDAPAVPDVRAAPSAPIALDMPTWFRPLPSLARAVSHGVADDMATASLSARADEATRTAALDSWAWGDPATGCYAILVRARTSSGDASVHRAVRDGFADTGVVIGDWRAPEGDERPSSFGVTFSPEPDVSVTGRISTRAVSGRGEFTTWSLACLYTERARAASANVCERVYRSFESFEAKT